MQPILIEQYPSRTRYKPGQRLDYSGIRIISGGRDVTAECQFLPRQGDAFPADRKRLTVSVSHRGSTASFEVSRSRSPIPFILLGCAVLFGGLAIWFVTHQGDSKAFPEGETGSYMIPQGGMTDEEAQALVNEMAEKSRITVSLDPEMDLKEDGQLHVNLVVEEPNNGFSERVEVEQYGKVVYRSGIVDPGFRLEWGQSEGAQVGPAVATVYAMSDGADTGNPISVEVEIVEAQS